MRLEGMKILDERLRWAAAFRKRVADECGRNENECFAGLEEIAGKGVDWRAAGYMKDPLKIVLMLRNAKACAVFRMALHKAHIQYEKASSTTILFLITAGTAEEHFEYLFRVCRQFRKLIGAPLSKRGSAKSVIGAVSEDVAVLPRDAALCDGELVTLDQSVGRIASQFLVPYPPGVPVFIPGLRITRAMVRLVKEVIAANGVDAVHGLFCRGGHAPYFVEVLNYEEESKVGWM